MGTYTRHMCIHLWRNSAYRSSNLFKMSKSVLKSFLWSAWYKFWSDLVQFIGLVIRGCGQRPHTHTPDVSLHVQFWSACQPSLSKVNLRQDLKKRFTSAERRTDLMCGEAEFSTFCPVAVHHRLRDPQRNHHCRHRCPASALTRSQHPRQLTDRTRARTGNCIHNWGDTFDAAEKVGDWLFLIPGWRVLFAPCRCRPLRLLWRPGAASSSVKCCSRPPMARKHKSGPAGNTSQHKAFHLIPPCASCGGVWRGAGVPHHHGWWPLWTRPGSRSAVCTSANTSFLPAFRSHSARQESTWRSAIENTFFFMPNDIAATAPQMIFQPAHCQSSPRRGRCSVPEPVYALHTAAGLRCGGCLWCSPPADRTSWKLQF